MFEKAINSAIYILDNLGESVDINPKPSTIQSHVMQARNIVKNLTKDELLEHKVSEDEVLLSIMMILSDILYSSWYVNRQLLALVSARITILTFKHGLSKYSAYGLVAFGAVLCGNGDKMGYRCGQLALAMLQKIKTKESIPLVYGVFYAVISPWYCSIHDAIVPLKLTHNIGLEIGSQESTMAGALTYSTYALLSGMNLATLLDHIEAIKSTVPILYKMFLCVNQAVLNFHETDSKNPALIEGKLFDYRICHDKNEKGYDVSRCLVICIFTACIFNDHNLALKFAKMCRPLANYISSFYTESIFLFYDGLVSLIAAKFEDDQEKEILIQRAKEIIARLRKMSEDAPENYLNKVHLLEAELAVVYDDENKVLSNFQSAIDFSIKHNFPHEEAIIRERAAMYYIQIGSVQQATQSLKQSFQCYKKWGAVAKLKDLILRFPTIFKEKGYTSDDFGVISLNIEVENHSMASISMMSGSSSYGKESNSYE